METGPGRGGEGQIPGHHQLLGEGWQACDPETGGDGALVDLPQAGQGPVFGVFGHQGSGQISEISHRPTQQTGCRHRIAVVGEDADPCLVHPFVVGQFLSLPASGQGACGDDLDVADVASLPHSRRCRRAPVDGRESVGHGNYGGEASGGRRPPPGRQILLPGLARVTEMDVEIDQTGPEPCATGVDHPVAVGLRLIADRAHRVTVDDDR
jgi:hypothetical protein